MEEAEGYHDNLRGDHNTDVSTTPELILDEHAVDAARLASVCERYGVVELAIFGSVARGEAEADSDVDLLYVLAPDAGLGFAFSRLEDELADLFGRPVHLVAKRSLHRLLRDEVLAEAVALYGVRAD